jgi:NifU-like protein involved in Fe-S cluster formation
MDFAELIEYWNEADLKGELDDRTNRVFKINPGCNDRVQIDVKIINGVLANAKYKAKGCVLSQAVAAFLLSRGIGLPVEDAIKIELPDFGITPVRKKCMLLSLVTYREALGEKTEEFAGDGEGA